jgi:hypothetical protein
MWPAYALLNVSIDQKGRVWLGLSTFIVPPAPARRLALKLYLPPLRRLRRKALMLSVRQVA